MDVGTKEGRDRDVASLLPIFPPRQQGSRLPASDSYRAENVLNKHYLRGLLPPPPMGMAVLGMRTRYLPMRRNLAHGPIKTSVRHRYHYYEKLNKIIATNSASPLDVARPDRPLLLGGYQSKPINCGSNERGYPAGKTRVGGCDVGEAASYAWCQW